MFWFGLFITLFAGVVVLSVGDRLRLSETTKGITVMSVMGVVAVLLMVLSSSGEEPKPKTPEELRQQRIESQFSAWDGSQRQLVERVKSTMNDPGSFEHVDTTYYDRNDQLLVHMKFRGANAFGGKVLNEVVADTDLDGKLLSVKTIDP